MAQKQEILVSSETRKQNLYSGSRAAQMFLTKNWIYDPGQDLILWFNPSAFVEAMKAFEPNKWYPTWLVFDVFLMSFTSIKPLCTCNLSISILTQAMFKFHSMSLLEMVMLTQQCFSCNTTNSITLFYESLRNEGIARIARGINTDTQIQNNPNIIWYDYGDFRFQE